MCKYYVTYQHTSGSCDTETITAKDNFQAHLKAQENANGWKVKEVFNLTTNKVV